MTVHRGPRLSSSEAVARPKIHRTTLTSALGVLSALSAVGGCVEASERPLCTEADWREKLLEAVGAKEIEFKKAMDEPTYGVVATYCKVSKPDMGLTEYRVRTSIRLFDDAPKALEQATLAALPVNLECIGAPTEGLRGIAMKDDENDDWPGLDENYTFEALRLVPVDVDEAYFGNEGIFAIACREKGDCSLHAWESTDTPKGICLEP